MTLAIPVRHFEYDVAFSFHSKDEELALTLSDLLRDRFKVFVYPHAQEELAGNDGAEKFTNIFGKTARVVVVLYREEWGESTWTAIEATAIRNRAFEDGFDFVTFINLVNGTSMPSWVPKVQLYLGLERFGRKSAAAVIERQIEQSGGRPVVETVQDMGARIQRQKQVAAERKAFLDSPAGVTAAQEAFTELCDLTEVETTALAAISPEMAFPVTRAQLAFVGRSGRCSLTYGYRVRYNNTTDESRLFVRVYKGAVGHPWSESHEALIELEYEFDVLGDTRRWRQRVEAGWGTSEEPRFFTSAALAAHALSEFLKLAHGEQA